jgi:RNA polymerase sigma factor (sigma-70 family)
MTSCDYGRAYADNYKGTVRALQRRGLSFTEAEEIAQAAWVKGWQRSSQLLDSARITSWVRTIAINLWRDVQRRQCRICTLGADHDELPSAHESLASIDLDRIIEMSSPPQREVLRKLLAGYSTNEIAHLLGISLGAAQHRISRARAVIRRMSVDA